MNSTLDGLGKMNPRALPNEKELPSSIQKFLSKATKAKPTKLQTTLNPSKTLPKIVTEKSQPSKTVSRSLYLKQLEYSRNYSKYIKDFESGKNREDVFPDDLETIPKRISEVRPNKEPDPSDSSTLIRHLIKTKPKPENKKRSGLKGQGLLQKPVIWCARCSKNHSIDYHSQKAQRKPAFSLPSKRLHPPPKPAFDDPQEYSEASWDDEEDDEDSFIEKDEGYEKVSKMVRSITGFDPRKYEAIDRMSTKGMESSTAQILTEERYTAKIGRMEDERELRFLKKKKRSLS